ncbi:hypothetical protein [Thiothrix fructosivorans]|uniref:Helix-turn-helix domain-containing protein n=1 Tax=Thiothrix fructosivorans TaxID=111770 RepID=A0A8B0SI15_9GAMM|nr:hypothetical protein [Thiothrix fructosivorans]MBO0611789.1 hypothetical protein [Thiothrix fructosivorans]QTX10555.1 hypothetical protein J1836_018620 [Thiothrix fructosivorans]
MDNKKADPATESTPVNAQTDNTKIRIACPYEHRLLSQLLRGQTSRKILDGIIGTTNTPEYVSRLRDRGLNIAMEWIPAINRDGKKIRHGAYYLLPDDYDRVRKSLGVTNG